MNFFTANTAPVQIHALNELIDPLTYIVFFGSILYILFLVVAFAAKKRQPAATDLCFCDKQVSIDECIESSCPTFAAVAEMLEDSALYGIAQESNITEITDPWETTQPAPVVFVPTFEELVDLNIRKLKSLASKNEITGYGKMRKHELAQALVGKVSTLEICF